MIFRKNTYKRAQEEKSKIFKSKPKKAQEEKSKIFKSKPKKAQEEILGFALIVIMIFVVLLIFLGISLRNPQKENIESYEVENFLQSALQYTTECSQIVKGPLSLKDLIFECRKGENCLSNKNSCEVLNSTLEEILKESWKIGGNYPTKAYELKIIIEETDFYTQKQGNYTANSKGSVVYFSKGGEDTEVLFQAYY